jgi:hypothetical protein
VIDLCAEFEDRKELFRADERRRYKNAAADTKHYSRRRCVFFNPDTAKPYTDVKHAFRTACQLVEIENLHWHDLRHTFGTRLTEAGCSEATAKRAAVEAVRALALGSATILPQRILTTDRCEEC